MTVRPKIRIFDDMPTLGDAPSAWIANAAAAGPLTVSLAGGSTPKQAYARLAGHALPWRNLKVFFGDERCVPPDDEGSNYRMVSKSLLKYVPVPEENVHRIPGELPPDDAARAAEADLRAAFPDHDIPRFDVMLLGIGEDGHTASLFPGSPDLDVTDRLYIPVHRPELPQPWRVSLTMPVLNAARHIVFLAADPRKADVVRRAAEGDTTLPAGRVTPFDGDLTWLVTRDVAEAAGLSPR